MLYQLSYASLLETPNLSLSLPETSRHTGQSSKDTTAELRVQAEATHFRIPVLERKCALYCSFKILPKKRRVRYPYSERGGTLFLLTPC
jgi:hypothetical protein